MSITTWNPWSEMMSLREAMDEMLRETFARPPSPLRMGMSGGALALPVDVQETNNDYVIRASMPGVSPSDIQVQIKGDTITVSGETREEYQAPAQAQQTQGQQAQQGQWLLKERRVGRFWRTITLPTEVKADGANATYENGVLTITLPKSEQARARSIPVQAGAGGPAQQIPAQGEVH